MAGDEKDALATFLGRDEGGDTFAEDREISEPGVVGEVLTRTGADPAVWLARAQEDATKNRLRENTEAAKVLGLFGAPSFVSGEEIFWGQDRLEDLDLFLSGKI